MFFFFFQAEDGIRDIGVTGVQTCALPISMRSVLAPLLAAALSLGALAASAPATGQGREQDAALKALRQGRIMPLRAIENRIVPKMRGYDYLGPEFNQDLIRYRLKFIRDGSVVWIDVDARTGQIVGQSGH